MEDKMKTEYKILMDFITHEEYVIVTSDDGDIEAGNIWSNYEEEEPRYLVKEVHKLPSGYYEDLGTLIEFDNYSDAEHYVELLEKKKGEKC